MKPLLQATLMFCCIMFSSAQTEEFNHESEKSEHRAPQILIKLNLLETIAFDGYNITFKSVENDSRCPEQVTCVWAGESLVILEIESSNKTWEKQIRIPAAGTSQSILSSSRAKLVLKNIKPYPVSPDDQLRDYYLLIDKQEQGED